MRRGWKVAILIVCAAAARGQSQSPVRVGIAGSEPFVVRTDAGAEGIAVEIWQAVAAIGEWRYDL